MAEIVVTDKEQSGNNFRYVQSSLSEVVLKTYAKFDIGVAGARGILTVDVPDEYLAPLQVELADKLAEIISINYKYNFFKSRMRIGGLSKVQTEILYTALISADFEEDKGYAFSKLKGKTEISLDGAFNFQMQPLKKKWTEICSFMPECFMQNQLGEFIGYLLDGRKNKVYVDHGIVYDHHYRRLNRTMLLGDTPDAIILREVILSGGGDVEIIGEVEKAEEKYLKEFYSSRISIAQRF